MKTIDLKGMELVELSSDEMKQIEGGFLLAFLLGVSVGIFIWAITN